MQCAFPGPTATRCCSCHPQKCAHKCPPVMPLPVIIDFDCHRRPAYVSLVACHCHCMLCNVWHCVIGWLGNANQIHSLSFHTTRDCYAGWSNFERWRGWWTSKGDYRWGTNAARRLERDQRICKAVTTFCHNCIKYWPFLKSSPVQAAVNLEWSDD